MTDAMAVEQKDLRPDCKQAECLLDQRPLPECQEAGNIGKADASKRTRYLLQAKVWVGKHGDSTAPLIRLQVIRNIYPAHMGEGIEQVGEDPP